MDEHLHEVLIELLQWNHPDNLPSADEWYIGYGPGHYEEAPYWTWGDEGGTDPFSQRESKTTLVRFMYQPGWARSYWNENANYIAIRYGNDWNPAHAREDHPSDGGEKFMIGGPLVDPVVTDHKGTVLKELREQSPRVKAGVELNRIFEVMHSYAGHWWRSGVRDYQEALPSGDELPDVFDDEVSASVPIGTVKGVGGVTIQRIAPHFAVYPNLGSAEPEDFAGLRPGWGNRPNLGEAIEIVELLDKHYRTLQGEMGWPDPERFASYPSGNPIDDWEQKADG